MFCQIYFICLKRVCCLHELLWLINVERVFEIFQNILALVTSCSARTIESSWCLNTTTSLEFCLNCSIVKILAINIPQPVLAIATHFLQSECLSCTCKLIYSWCCYILNDSNKLEHSNPWIALLAVAKQSSQHLKT